MSLFKLFKKPKNQIPLPARQILRIEDIPPASVILFYNGNKITELFGSRVYGHKYDPPPFHAALYIDNGLFLNVGKFKEIRSVDTEFKTTRRIDVITYSIVPLERKKICTEAFKDSSRPHVGITLPDYAMTDYLRFGFKWFKPSKKDFCSENVVELMNIGNVKVSDLESFNTAPWDLVEYAESNPDICWINTLFVGDDYLKKFRG